MAVYFMTNDVPGLLKAFKDKISQGEKKGRIETWEEVKGGFAHTSDQWKDLAIAVPSNVKLGGAPALKFHITSNPDGKPFTDVGFAVYQGTLLQTFITHFSGQFDSARYIDRRKK